MKKSLLVTALLASMMSFAGKVEVKAEAKGFDLNKVNVVDNEDKKYNELKEKADKAKKAHEEYTKSKDYTDKKEAFENAEKALEKAKYEKKDYKDEKVKFENAKTVFEPLKEKEAELKKAMDEAKAKLGHKVASEAKKAIPTVSVKVSDLNLGYGFKAEGGLTFDNTKLAVKSLDSKIMYGTKIASVKLDGSAKVETAIAETFKAPKITLDGTAAYTQAGLLTYLLNLGHEYDSHENSNVSTFKGQVKTEKALGILKSLDFSTKVKVVDYKREKLVIDAALKTVLNAKVDTTLDASFLLVNKDGDYKTKIGGMEEKGFSNLGKYAKLYATVEKDAYKAVAGVEYRNHEEGKNEIYSKVAFNTKHTFAKDITLSTETKAGVYSLLTKKGTDGFVSAKVGLESKVQAAKKLTLTPNLDVTVSGNKLNAEKIEDNYDNKDNNALNIELGLGLKGEYKANEKLSLSPALAFNAKFNAVNRKSFNKEFVVTPSLKISSKLTNKLELTTDGKVVLKYTNKFEATPEYSTTLSYNW